MPLIPGPKAGEPAEWFFEQRSNGAPGIAPVIDLTGPFWWQPEFIQCRLNSDPSVPVRRMLFNIRYGDPSRIAIPFPASVTQPGTTSFDYTACRVFGTQQAGLAGATVAFGQLWLPAGTRIELNWDNVGVGDFVSQILWGGWITPSGRRR